MKLVLLALLLDPQTGQMEWHAYGPAAGGYTVEQCAALNAGIIYGDILPGAHVVAHYCEQDTGPAPMPPVPQ